MKTLGYYNGTIDELDRLCVPMLDRACYFGDGVYDVAYSRNYVIYAMEEHVSRFFQSARALRMEPPLSESELCSLLLDLTSKLERGEQWVYFQLSRGASMRSHAFPEECKPNLWVMLKPAEIRDTYKEMKCITAEDTRFQYCNIKSLNLLPNVLATQATVEASADECILCRDGIVTECAHSNISILKGGVLYTHPADRFILAGTGRAHLIAACKALKIPVKETAYTLADLKNADEILITSASALCMRVTEADGARIGGKDGAKVKALQDFLLADFLKKTEKR